MNQTLIASVLNKNVYFISDPKVPFYVSIPNGESVNIVLNLVDDISKISISSSNMTNLTNEITNIYSKFNFSNIAVVTPVLDSNLLEQVKLNNGDSAFSYLDKFMGYLINTSYSFLKNNNIEVENKIKLNNNISYKYFNEWFVNRYNGRVELVDYSNAPVNSFENVSQVNVSNEIADSVLDETSVMEPVSNVSGGGNIKEPGFVSYVLLGVLVAVISLVILYLLL